MCVQVTADFLAFARARGNDLVTPAPEYRLPRLSSPAIAGACARRTWREAYEAGVAAPVVLAATHEETLAIIPLDALKRACARSELSGSPCAPFATIATAPPDVLHVADIAGAGARRGRGEGAGPRGEPQSARLEDPRRARALDARSSAARRAARGCDFAGEIVGVGGGARRAMSASACSARSSPFPRDGALAEFVVVPRRERRRRFPTGSTSSTPPRCRSPGGTALQALVDHAKLAAGQRVLITGAAGGVGHFAVQIAKHLGAHVVGVCSGANAEFVRGLGADEVIDYAREDFTRRADRFDVVFDAAGASSFAAARQVLTEDGCYINTRAARRGDSIRS